jgi:cytochrome o ubiquinol oxidase subunit 2
MDKKLKIAFFLLLTIVGASLFLVFLNKSGIAIFTPKGVIAKEQYDLLKIATLMMLIVVVPVFLLTFFIVWKYRKDNKNAEYAPDWDNSHIAESIWWGVPFVIILIIGVITTVSCYKLDPFRPIASSEKPTNIQAVALEWKWLFIYPEEGIATLNYIEFPVNVPIQFDVTADGPMNSLWIPQLGSQVYAMAGMDAKLNLMATEEGVFQGKSVNFSGYGFSGMTFEAKSTTKEDYKAWIQEIKKSSSTLTKQEYEALLIRSSYVKPQTYVLKDKDLYNQIIKKFMDMDHASSH